MKTKTVEKDEVNVGTIEEYFSATEVEGALPSQDTVNSGDIIHIMGIDTSTKTGFSYMSYNKSTEEACLLRYGMIMISTADRTEGSYIAELYDKISKLLDQYPTDVCFVEHFYVNSRAKKSSGIDTNYFLRAAVLMQLHLHEIPYFLFSSFVWKKAIMQGNIKLTAKQRKEMGPKAQKVMIQRALEDRFNLHFPTHVPSAKSSRQVQMYDDPIDASAFCLYGIMKDHEPTNMTVINNGTFEYI